MAYVRRRIGYRGVGTQRTVMQQTLREVWVQEGDAWKLKSSTVDK